MVCNRKDEICWHHGATCKSCIHYIYRPDLDWVDHCDDGFECDIYEAESCSRYEIEKGAKSMDYVFHLYKGSDDKVYIERLKIVYQNKTYFYAKKHGSDRLLIGNKSNTYESINVIPKGRFFHRRLDEYVWNVSAEEETEFNDKQRLLYITKLKAQLEECQRNLNFLEKATKDELAKFEDRKNRILAEVETLKAELKKEEN